MIYIVEEIVNISTANNVNLQDNSKSVIEIIVYLFSGS